MQETTCNAGDGGLVPGSGTSPGQVDPLETKLATNSNILAWEIPWTEESGELHSMVSQEKDTT